MSHKNLDVMFAAMPEPKGSRDLHWKILHAVRLEQERVERRQWMMVRLSNWGAFVAMLVSLNMFGAPVLRSEFWSLSSLVFSDTSIVLENWREFLFSLLETFPAAALSAVLLSVFALAVSMVLRSHWQGTHHHYA